MFSNIQDRRVRRKPEFKLGQLVSIADIKKVFSKRDSLNLSYKFYTITEVIYDIVLSLRINYLPERYNQNVLLPTKLSLDVKFQVLKN